MQHDELPHKKHLFTVFKKDCRFDYFRGSGKGGMKRNKTESGVRITHLASGSVGVSDDTRSQNKNKKIAFTRMANCDKMKKWLMIETARATGKLAEIDSTVKEYMKPKNLKVEVHDEKGLWVKEIK